MTRRPDWGFKGMDEQVLHAYTECPEGKLIAIAKRDSVATNDPKAMEGLEWCPWCEAQDRTDNPRRTTGTCAFCGLLRELTRDHVPPENLFLPPRTSDLITVPCCDACREGTSKDDEYFRIALSIRMDASSHPSLAALRPKILRGLGRPEAERFTKHIESRTERQMLSTPSGLLVPVTIHTPEPEPIHRELTRIAKGLYFHHTGGSLPASFTA